MNENDESVVWLDWRVFIQPDIVPIPAKYDDDGRAFFVVDLQLYSRNKTYITMEIKSKTFRVYDTVDKD